MTRKPVSRTSEKTRQAVIDAAIHCLATEGYHRATSNRIARQAGLSWGVIQYHFADRAGIYRAVLDTIIDSYVLELDHIARFGKGKSISERLFLLAISVWELLNHPAYLATMELLVNLTRDEGLAINTQAYVRRWSERMAVMWRDIFPEFPEEHLGSIAARQIFFATLRGFVDNRMIGQWQGESIPKELTHSMVLGLTAIMTHIEDGK